MLTETLTVLLYVMGFAAVLAGAIGLLAWGLDRHYGEDEAVPPEFDASDIEDAIMRAFEGVDLGALTEGGPVSGVDLPPEVQERLRVALEEIGASVEFGEADGE